MWWCRQVTERGRPAGCAGVRPGIGGTVLLCLALRRMTSYAWPRPSACHRPDPGRRRRRPGHIGQDRLAGGRDARRLRVRRDLTGRGPQVLNRRGHAGAVIPNANLQAGLISGCGYDDPPRVRRNRLASIQEEVGDHPFETVGIKPAHGQALMMMLDRNVSELLSHTYHPDRALDCVNDVSGSADRECHDP